MEIIDFLSVDLFLCLLVLSSVGAHGLQQFLKKKRMYDIIRMGKGNEGWIRQLGLGEARGWGGVVHDLG